MKTQELDSFDTYKLAKLAGASITNLHRRPTATGCFYHVRLNGEMMRVEQARKQLLEKLKTYEQSSTSPGPTGGRQAEKLQQSGT